MPSLFAPAVALAALAAVPAVTAHGYVSGVVINGKWQVGGSPNWIYDTSSKPQQPGWFAYNQDLGFVSPSEYSDENITCHKGATPGTTSITVAAGSSMDLQWTTWSDSHHGPVITYLARCHGPCNKADPAELNFFKIEEAGLIDGSAAPGSWATDKLIANNNTWTTTIPSGISGDFILRHEIIALHSAGSQNGAQNYPMCLNLKITGSGTAHPCLSGADCAHGTELYKATDPGILINIYTTLKSYKIPGPKTWKSASKRMARRVAKAFVA